jgi:hypothetical protein
MINLNTKISKPKTMNNSEIFIYQNPEGSIKIDVRLEEETVWLTQSQICDLFQKSKATISEHIKNVFEERELNENSVVRNFRTTAEDGKNYQVMYFNLDANIYIGRDDAGNVVHLSDYARL